MLASFALIAALSQPTPRSAVTAIVGVTIFTEPGARPIEDGVIIISGSTIQAIGRRAVTTVPRSARVVECAGCAAFAGFWNSHVHFGVGGPGATLPPAAAIQAGLDSMLLRYGFVHVLDTGSNLGATVALRRRIDSGELPGPEIRTAGFPFAPPNGSPFYIAPLKLPELRSPAVVADSVAARVAGGADAIKIFAASPAELGKPPVMMDRAVIRAVVEAAHARGRLVAAHPTTNAGALGAIEAGVDILLHTTPDGDEPWDRAFLDRAVAAKISLTPTLKLWKWELERAHRPAELVTQFVGLAQGQLRAFVAAGGDVLFGTDVGYMTDYDPSDEYRFMQAAGMSLDQILASLTTNPARRFGVEKSGKLAPSYQADLVLTSRVPAGDLAALAEVRFAWRAGRQVWGEGR